VEPKIDGLSVSAEYRDGKYFRGLSRGNGQEGEDITKNLANVKGLPREIDEKGTLIVRGEVYMPIRDFRRVNEEREKSGDTPFANPRNCAVGTLKQSDPALVSERGLSILVFNVQKSDTLYKTHTEAMGEMKKLGFAVCPSEVCDTAEEVIRAIDVMGETRTALPYGTDGAVVKLDRLADREVLGATDKVPRWAIAYKFKTEQKESVVTGITLQVGRTGRITPVAELGPVQIGGSTVTRASLHNQDIIDDIGVGVGDTVLVQKAGEIIPEIVKVTAKGNGGVFKIPLECPVCHSLAIVDGADVRCANEDCPARLSGRVSFFASKDCMDIDGFGPAVADAITEDGYVKSLPDIYKLGLRRDRLASWGRVGREKAVDKLLAAVEISKDVPFERFFKALGIKGAGAHVGKVLAERFGDTQEVLGLSESELAELPGIGKDTASAIYLHFREHGTEIRALLGAGVKPVMRAKPSGGAFFGKTFVITGTLPSVDRRKAEEIITENGGKVSSGVSKNTDFLLAGDSAGSKLEKAKALGITILSEDDLLSMLGS
jgi:DNA ligase (NAD+)